MDKSLEELVNRLPKSPGVYSFSDKEGKIIYIGKAIDLRERVKSYFKPVDPKTKLMTAQVAAVEHINVFSEFESLLLEASLIRKFLPKYNSRLRDDKSFLYIAITAEDFPKVKAARKTDMVKPKYLFGPFPSAKTVRQVLRFLRRIIPYCSQNNDRHPCFWSHLGLCRPCPGAIAKLEGKERDEARRLYLNNIRNLAAILQGKSKKLSYKLEKEMEKAAREKKFEEAGLLRDQLQKITYLTTYRFPISSYLEQNNFFEEEQARELQELAKVLEIPLPIRIECYDISNILGQFASGSLVTFINGIQNTAFYRKFRIRMAGQPNDVAMMTEVLQRRLKHQDWTYPELIIVDGGKPQVAAAAEVLARNNLVIPLVGLAKRLEEIVLRTKEGKWQIIKLPNNSPALNLLKRIRDESHRFALSYHRKLRAKNWGI